MKNIELKENKVIIDGVTYIKEITSKQKNVSEWKKIFKDTQYQSIFNNFFDHDLWIGDNTLHFVQEILEVFELRLQRLEHQIEQLKDIK